MSDYTQLALNEFGNLPNDRFLTAIFYCAARCYSTKGSPWRYTEADVKGWIDRMTNAEAQKIMNAMMESRIGGESLMDLIEKSTDEKKKFIPRTSKITP